MRRGLLLTFGVLVAACGERGLFSTGDSELRVLPEVLDFGDVYLGQRASLSLQVTNTGKLDVQVALAPAVPFETVRAMSLAGGSSAAVSVDFVPALEGSAEASLEVGGRKVALKGNGVVVPMCLAPAEACRATAFDPGAGQCVTAPKPNGEACATACIKQGACAAGACLGAFAECSDDDLCTDDGCREETGCTHAAKVCPSPPGNKCGVPSCDPKKGCQLTEAIDGTPCGPRSCQAKTTHVCIAATCVERALPTNECLNLFGYLKASNGQSSDGFGSKLALSADGNTLAVGSFVENSTSRGVGANQQNNLGSQVGAVYVFRRVGGSWQQEVYLKASNAGSGDSFGYAIAISSDGNTLVVGAHLEDSNATGIDGNGENNAAHDSGAAYVFHRSGNTWTQDAYLKATNTEQNDYFGTSVAISGDGKKVAVGAPSEDGAANSKDDSGAVYLFADTGNGWAADGVLRSSVAEAGDQFGFSLALSGNGAVLAVGIPGEDSRATGIGGDASDNSATQSGAVRVFTGAAFVEDVFVKASNTGAGDAFGISVSLSGDGASLAVGAYGEDSSDTGINHTQTDNLASQSGAVYVYRRGVAWAQEAYVKASNTQVGDSFGFAVALSADGKALTVGAFGENSGSTGVDGHPFNSNAPDSGAMFLFRRTMAWAQEAYLKATNTDEGDGFGYSVAISGDGATIAAGAAGEDSAARTVNGSQADNAALNSGAAYVYSQQ